MRRLPRTPQRMFKMLPSNFVKYWLVLKKKIEPLRPKMCA